MGELSPINVPWDQEFSGGPTSWTWVSHLRVPGLIPYCNSKTPKVTQNRVKDKGIEENRSQSNIETNKGQQKPKQMVKAVLNRQEHPKTDTLTKRGKGGGVMIKTGTQKEAINQGNK